MKKRSVFQRAVLPVLVLLGVMILSINMYNMARHVETRALHMLLAHGSAFLMFLSIWLGALFVNTVSFFRGATFSERLVICLATPVVWCIKVLTDFAGIYSLGEFIFIFVHNLILGCPVVALLCMGVSEIWCRIIERRRTGDGSIRIFSINNSMALLTGFGLTFLMLWNGGHSYYYFYMDIYTLLFL